MCEALHEHYNKVLLSHKFSVIILIPTPLRLNLQVWIVCPWGVKREAHVTGYFQQVHAWLDSAREDGIIYECVVFQVFLLIVIVIVSDSLSYLMGTLLCMSKDLFH